MAKLRVAETVGSLGDYLREQRSSAQMSLRQLSDLAGVSNPYLSQIAKALRISAETLYVRAGILDPDETGQRSVQLAVLADTTLSERQKSVLLDIYESFCRDNTSTKRSADAGA
jgi:transcriptional regulator with XRE-family HTH domain